MLTTPIMYPRSGLMPPIQRVARLLQILCLCVFVFISQRGTPLFAQAGSHATPLEIHNGLTFVQVMINGKGPFRFIVDTGTGGDALVSPELVAKLGLASVGETEAGDPSGLNPQKVLVYELASLKVAGLEFTKILVTGHEPGPREGASDGVLGFRLFRDYLFTLDYPAKQLILSKGELTSDDQKSVLPFIMPDSIPLIELQVENKRICAHIDSGGAGLSLPEDFVRDIRFVSDPVVIGRGRTVSNDFVIKGARLASDIQIAGYTLSHPFIEINSVLPDANFGAIPLRHFAVTFDQKNKLVRFVSKDRIVTISSPPRGAAPGQYDEPPSAP